MLYSPFWEWVSLDVQHSSMLSVGGLSESEREREGERERKGERGRVREREREGERERELT